MESVFRFTGDTVTLCYYARMTPYRTQDSLPTMVLIVLMLSSAIPQRKPPSGSVSGGTITPAIMNGTAGYLHDRQHHNDHPTVVDTEGHLRGRISELCFIWQGQLRNEPIIRVNSQLIQ